MQGTIWALLPPLIAIVLGLTTKKINLALLVGIIIGCLLYTNNFIAAINAMFELMVNRLGENIGIILFVVMLGMIVYLINSSGAINSYSEWIGKKIHTRRSALVLTALLGLIIFVDDYFNCLTVGTAMKPITDKNKVSREKLAYVIDATTAPVCMIAPISSWAAAVSSSLPESSSLDGYRLFINTITTNYYSLFSILIVFIVCIFECDFPQMLKYEENEKNRLPDDIKDEYVEHSSTVGKTIDIVCPIIALILCSVGAMIFSGIQNGGNTIREVFASCDAVISLNIGSFLTLIIIAFLYLPRKVISLDKFCEGLGEGLKKMSDVILILTFAWTLSGICGEDYLDAGHVAELIVLNNNVPMQFIPLFMFLIAVLISFSTGTSWGTFSILIPITVSIFGDSESQLLIMTVAAVLGGSVCGDHISPISDTTILSAAGAGCSHVSHVSSQLPYGVLAAISTAFTYLVWGICNSIFISSLVGIGMIIVSLVCIKKMTRASL